MKNIIVTKNIHLFEDQCVLQLDPEKCQTLRGLYEEIADALEFPDHFGFNLDSLDEMLNDLSWLEDEKIVLWFQNSNLFLAHERNQEKKLTIIDLLDATAEEWRWAEDDEDFPKKTFRVVFEPSEPIISLLNKAEVDYDTID